MMKLSLWITALILTLLVGCQPVAPNADAQQKAEVKAMPTAHGSGEQHFPNILTATLTLNQNGQFDVAVTVSSPYDTAQRYADAWRLIAPDGTILGERILLHDHATEQPFTRMLNDVVIPSNVFTLTVEGRDQVYGYGGKTVVIDVPDRSKK